MVVTRFWRVADRNGTGAPATLIDEQSGRRLSLLLPGCWPAAVGGGLVAFSCGSAPELKVQLYSIADGTVMQLATTQSLESSCRSFFPLAYGCTVSQVGSDWVGFGNNAATPTTSAASS